MRSLFAALVLGLGVMTGMVAAPNSTQALPAAPVSQPLATPDTSVEKVGYYRRHNRHYGHRHYGNRHYGYRSYGYRPHFSGFSFHIGPRYRHHGYRNYGYRSYGHGYRHW